MVSVKDLEREVVAWWRYCSDTCLQVLTKPAKDFRQDNWCPGRFSNRLSPEYKCRAVALTLSVFSL